MGSQMNGGGGRPEPPSSLIAAKAEPISVIWRDYLKKVDSTPIHVTCKFARRHGKDCESEVHVNLDFRIGLRLFQKWRSY